MMTKQTLSNGMACFTIPKKGYEEKQAAIIAKYGGADYIHLMPDGSKLEMPTGIAHFLEHKIFEDPLVNMFEAFTSSGASVNAYTHFTHTVYYFNTVGSFAENLALLFKLVGNPHFTDDNIEKEKGIILSEIDMYADDPYWQVHTGLNEALFCGNFRQNILGTKESVRSITPSQLYNCYNHFYTPKNMALICIGDLESDQVQEWAESHLLKGHCQGVTSFYEKELTQAISPFTEKYMTVSIPLFQMGFKALYNEVIDPVSLVASSILVDMIAGESSAAYAHLYDKGLIDNNFSVEYICGVCHGVFLFSGASTQPEAVRDYILQTIVEGLSEKRFDIIKSKHMGRYIRGFNSIDNLSCMQADLFTKGLDMESVMEALRKVKLNDVEKQLNTYLRTDNCSISVIKPNK